MGVVMAEEESNQTVEGGVSSQEIADDNFLAADIRVEEAGFGPAYAIAQWVNGNPKNKQVGGIAYTGGFFVSVDANIPEAELKAAGFDNCTLVTNDGNELKGYSIRNLRIVPVRYRRCWQVTPATGLAQRFGNDEFDEAQLLGKPRGVSHLLVEIPKITQPVMLTFRGMTSKEILGMGKDRGIIPSYGAKILGAAKQVARAAGRKTEYPLCAFQLTIGPETEADGKKPKFTEVGTTDKSQITVPVWVDEPNGVVTKEHLGSLFVGNEHLGVLQDWHGEADEWVEAFSTENLAARRARLSGKKGASATSSSGAASEDGVPGPNDMRF